MAIRYLGNNSDTNTGVLGKTLPFSYSAQNLIVEPTPWVRNPTWPACVANPGDNKITGLYAVFPGDGNFIAMNNSGAYTVNYGDGTITNYAASSQANYIYDYNSAALVGTDGPVTFTDVGDVVNRTAHGYTNGMTVQFYNIVNTTGIVNAQTYYVVNATADNFQVSATLGGSAIALTTDGTGTLLPYRIATVTITPQAGNNLTSINLFIKLNTINLNDGYVTGWLQLAIASSTISALVIGGSAFTVRHFLLESVLLNQLGSISNSNSLFYNLTKLQDVVISNTITTITNAASMFQNCRSLQTVPLFNTAAVIFTNNMFSGCSSLVSVPLFNTASAVNMGSMFASCSSLQSVPSFNTPAAYDTNSMFSGCSSLVSVPLFNTAAVTSMNSMFNGCHALRTVPLFNTAAVTGMNGMFTNCFNLQTVPLFNTAIVNNMSGMFNSCYNLKTVPLFNTVAVTTMSSMFASCYNLNSVPLFNTVAVTTMSSMFLNCYKLRSVPLFNTALVQNMGVMFSGCYRLESVPLFNTAAVTSMNSMFSNCTALVTVPLFNTALVQNMGSMFNGCYKLESVPLFNTALVNNMSSMFTNCLSLKSVPLFNTAAVTTMSGMFNSCYSLQTVPLFNTAIVTDMSFMFLNCRALQSVPLFNTAAVTNMTYMINNCFILQSVPLFNTAAVTNMSFMFANASNLTSVPLFNTAAVTTMGSMLNSCNSLASVPAFVTSAVTSSTNLLNMFAGCSSINRIEAKNFNYTFSVANCKLSATALEEIFTNLPTVSGQTITITNNYGANGLSSVSGTLSVTAGSKTVLIENTSPFAVGQEVMGSGMPITTPTAVTFTDSGDLVSKTAHGLQNGDEISFPTITTTTGITAYTIYYVINATTDDFQIAATLGGVSIPLTNNGSGTMIYRSEIESVVTNTSFTLTRPATASISGTSSIVSRLGTPLKTWRARARGWAITG